MMQTGSVDRPVQSLAEIKTKFGGVPGLSFDERNGLVRALVATKAATATVYQQGAHLTSWKPTGFEEAIFVSSQSPFAPGKPIRGGVPVVFPWFSADRRDVPPEQRGPTHGFARIQPWELVAAAAQGDATRLRFELGPTAMSRSMGFDDFLLRLEFTLGRELEMTLTVENLGTQPLRFEEDFHTYFHVADIHEVKVTGLEPAGYLDKVQKGVAMPASHAAVTFSAVLDRVYNGTTAPLMATDTAGRRRIHVSKSGSASTVLWNPFAAVTDLGEWDWHSMLALEAANLGSDAVTLAAGASKVMAQHVRLERL